MKKLFCLLVLSLAAVPAFASQASLYRQYDGKNVKAHVAEVKDSTPEKKMDLSLLRQKIKDVLLERRSTRFEIVDDPAQADLSVTADIQGFYWTDHDPVDMLIGVGGTAMDAAVVEDYARAHALFEVTDMKIGRVVWKDTVVATLTKKPMSETESLPLISEDLAKVFVRGSFGKTRR